MSQINQSSKRTLSKNWSFLLPILLLAPMSMAAKGCDAVVGDDCPEGMVCAAGASNNGSAGSPGAGASTIAGAPGLAGSSSIAGASSGAGASGLAGGPGSAGSGAAGGPGTGNPLGGDCGGLLGIRCDTGLYCEYELEAQCGNADQTGTCQKKPDACDAVYAPVCGCDGKTYGNSCEAALASVSVAKQGACGPTGKSCGGLIGAACEAGEFCDYPLEMACGNADGTGTCEAVPQTCTKEIAEVCGCDGKTYSNACVANSAGTSIYKTGKCPTK